jgi:hypothetical protein
MQDWTFPWQRPAFASSMAREALGFELDGHRRIEEAWADMRTVGHVRGRSGRLAASDTGPAVALAATPGPP